MFKIHLRTYKIKYLSVGLANKFRVQGFSYIIYYTKKILNYITNPFEIVIKA